jgi:predicted NAD/FAD-binding protein
MPVGPAVEVGAKERHIAQKVVVVGGGVVGSSIAYFLASHPGFAG